MPFDRDAIQLTNFVVPNMPRPMAPRPERDSIYGNTYGGVPNPMIPHQHPYPTRYHGPVFDYPQPGYRYATRPYAEKPFNGDDSLEFNTCFDAASGKTGKCSDLRKSEKNRKLVATIAVGVGAVALLGFLFLYRGNQA